MNYCTKCQSYYQRPGTCNCFATVRPIIPVPYPQPWTPWTQPTTVPALPWPGTTIIYGTIGNDLTRTTVCGGIVNNGSVSIANAAGNQPLQISQTSSAVQS